MRTARVTSLTLQDPQPEGPGRAALGRSSAGRAGPGAASPPRPDRDWLVGVDRVPAGQRPVGGVRSSRSRSRSRPSDPGLVLPGPRVDADRVAGLDEDRHLDDEPGLGRGRLARAGLRVAGEARARSRRPPGRRSPAARRRWSRPGSSSGRASSRPSGTGRPRRAARLRSTNWSYVSVSMKWKSSPSRYRNWTGRCSSCARGHFVPAWNERSIVWPRLMLRSVMRTWAEPRPILMWW